MSNKKKESYNDLIQDFFNILNLPEFKEVDKRIKKISKNIKENTDFTNNDFIYYLLNYFDYLDVNVLDKIRITLYQQIDLVNKIVKNVKSEIKLKNLLSNKEIQNIIVYFNYKINIETTTLLLLNKLYEISCNEVKND